MTLAFATGNKGKLREASEILGEGYTLVTPTELGIFEEIPETGQTLAENSLQKAQYLHARCGCDCFADDTGLEVDARCGSQEGHDSQANMARLLRELVGISIRTARFHTVVTYIGEDGAHVFEGFVEGRIAEGRSGDGGFGYDPVFIPDLIPGPDGTLVPNSGSLTLAQISEADKNLISHRGMALRAMASWLHGR